MQSTQLIIAVSVLGVTWLFALGAGLIKYGGRVSTGQATDDTHDDLHGTRATSGRTTPTVNDQTAGAKH